VQTGSLTTQTSVQTLSCFWRGGKLAGSRS